MPHQTKKAVVDNQRVKKPPARRGPRPWLRSSGNSAHCWKRSAPAWHKGDTSNVIADIASEAPDL